MRSAGALAALVVVVGAGAARPAKAAWTWETLDFPGAGETYPMGISGDLVMGEYSDQSGSHGFVYDRPRGTWRTLDYASAGRTILTGVFQDSIVGNYGQNAFPYEFHAVLYDGLSWTSLSHPQASSTYALGVSAGRIVGSYQDGTGLQHGFHYDGTEWITVDYPGAVATSVSGTFAGGIIGTYTDSEGRSHGFVYDGTNWATLDSQLASFGGTLVAGISGSTTAGSIWTLGWGRQQVSLGFLMEGGNWDYFGYPAAKSTFVRGISGNSIVGYYRRGDPESYDVYEAHGYVLTIPEPASLALLVLGGSLVILRRYRQSAPGP